MKKIISLLLLLTTIVHADDYREMDNLALHFDSNRASGKGSNWHNYTEIYSRYFAPLKDKPIKFFEIGIFEGNGVMMWEQYFKNAELHFMDITYSYAKYFSTRSHYHLGDQANAKDLLSIMNTTGGDFDIMIDDGGHTMVQQLVSFITLFPYVKSGGMYIIEDLHTSYWKDYGGGGSYEHPKAGPGTFINFLKTLIDDVNFVGARTLCADHNKIPADIEKDLDIYKKQIFSMHFYDSMCFILKR